MKVVSFYLPPHFLVFPHCTLTLRKLSSEGCFQPKLPRESINTTRTSAVILSTPTTASTHSLETLPAEIRSMIYRHLFPEFYLPAAPHYIEIYRNIEKLIKPAKQLIEQTSKWTRVPSASTTVNFDSELSTIRNLQLSSRLFHTEITPFIYHSNTTLHMITFRDLCAFPSTLTQRTRRLIHRLAVKTPNSSSYERQRMIRLLSRALR